MAAKSGVLALAWPKPRKVADFHCHEGLGHWLKAQEVPFMSQQKIITQYLSAQDAAALIRKQGLAQSLNGMAQYIGQDFKRWGDFKKTARLAHHGTDGVIELMPIGDERHYTFKYVNGHPKNTRKGLPTVMAFGVLASVDSGMPQFLSELTLTTAVRTAATSVIAAKALARSNSKVMALIGNGAQSEFQALAFHHLLGITQLRLFDIDPQATAKLVANMAGMGLKATVCANVREAVLGADIVTTITADKTNATILTEDMLVPGMHINAVGGDCPGKTELAPGVLQANSVFVEYEAQTRIEGDLQQMPADFPVTELWRVLRGQSPGRTKPDQITVFDSVGFALEDFSALRYMRDSAIALDMMQTLSLIPELDDPKNLFSMVVARPSSGMAQTA
jgi:ornithine cyclodeaminase